jgi:hypothetical protein
MRGQAGRESLPENAFINSIRVDRKALADTIVDLSGGVNGAKVNSLSA